MNHKKKINIMCSYEKFELYDFKENKIILHTCNPQYLGNYFVESKYPYETSPVFFNKKVLGKYKYDSENYEISTFKIICRNDWSLRYYLSDNKEQVITLIKDLSLLPINEQKYWKSFNQKPKSWISNEIINTVYEGKWIESNSLDKLKNILRNFPACKIDNKIYYIWKEPKTQSPHKIDDLDYVKIGLKKEWEDEIQTLHLNIIQGLNSKTLSLILLKLDCKSKTGTINQLENCLKCLEINNEDILSIIKPLRILNSYRSEIISHPTGEKFPDEDLNQNFQKLLDSCCRSFSILSKFIKEGFFDLD